MHWAIHENARSRAADARPLRRSSGTSPPRHTIRGYAKIFLTWSQFSKNSSALVPCTTGTSLLGLSVLVKYSKLLLVSSYLRKRACDRSLPSGGTSREI